MWPWQSRSVPAGWLHPHRQTHAERSRSHRCTLLELTVVADEQQSVNSRSSLRLLWTETRVRVLPTCGRRQVLHPISVSLSCEAAIPSAAADDVLLPTPLRCASTRRVCFSAPRLTPMTCECGFGQLQPWPCGEATYTCLIYVKDATRTTRFSFRFNLQTQHGVIVRDDTRA